MRRRIGLIALALLMLVAACDSLGRPGGAAALLPDVPNAKVIEGQTISEYIATLSSGASLLSGNPPLVAAIEFAQAAITCYQDIGAVAIRVYSDEAFPLSSGLVAVVDRNAITDLGNLARCLGGGQANSAQAAISICANTYTLKKDDNEFYIAYLGTTEEMCQAFCARLEGCSENSP
jgi:hypothetical protein